MIRKGGISFSALPLEMNTLNGSGGGGGTAFLHSATMEASFYECNHNGENLSFLSKFGF